MTDKEKIRAEIKRLAQLHLEMLEGYRADGSICAAAIEDVLYGHDLSILSFIDSLQEDPVSDDLEAEIEKIIECEDKFMKFHCHSQLIQYVAHYFANWQQEQFEKEQLKHCDELTAEQAQIESDFVVNHLKKNNRTLTFIDAIEYGMRLQKEKMIANAVDGVCISNGAECGASIESSAGMLFLQHNTFDVGDKVKLIIVNED